MRINRPTVVFALAALAAAPLASQEISEEDYEAAMTEIRLLVGDANQHIDSFYWPELGEDIEKFYVEFEKVEAFWQARGDDEAVAFAQEAMTKLEAVATAGENTDTGAARAAVRDLQSTCQACHAQFREETADGYRIKQ